MFSIVRVNRPIIPTRLPESEDKPRVDMEAISSQSVTALSAVEAQQVEEFADNLDTPATTPLADNGGEGSTDEQSVEEPTVEEAMQLVVAVPEDDDTAKIDDVEVSTDESTYSDEGISESDEDLDEYVLFNLRACKSYRVWCMFWVMALVMGILAYYMKTHQDMVMSRLGDASEEMNLLLMPREKWDDSSYHFSKPSSYTAQRVAVVQTDTETCDTTVSCARLLNAMKIRQQKRQEGPLKYNFLLATDGCIYEALGWQEPSPMFPDDRTMVVAFIGNYETFAPSTMQLSQLQALLEASQELKYLSNTYSIIGKKQTVMPSKLFAYLSTFQHWDKENSDTDEQYIDIDFDPFPIFDN